MKEKNLKSYNFFHNVSPPSHTHMNFVEYFQNQATLDWF